MTDFDAVVIGAGRNPGPRPDGRYIEQMVVFGTSTQDLISI